MAERKNAEAVESAVKVIVARGEDVEKYKGVLDLARADEGMTMEETIRKLVVVSEVMYQINASCRPLFQDSGSLGNVSEQRRNPGGTLA